MKIKLIDLLYMIAEDKLCNKSKIIFDDEVYTYNREMKLLCKKGRHKSFYGFQLNDLVEIVKSDEETEIIEEKPKKIGVIGNLADYKGNTVIGANMWTFYYKLNELTKAVNYLLEKSDKDEY